MHGFDALLQVRFYISRGKEGHPAIPILCACISEPAATCSVSYIAIAIRSTKHSNQT